MFVLFINIVIYYKYIHIQFYIYREIHIYTYIHVYAPPFQLLGKYIFIQNWILFYTHLIGKMRSLA